MEVNQHPNGLPVNNIDTGFIKDGQQAYEEDSNSSNSSDSSDNDEELKTEKQFASTFQERIESMIILPNQTFLLTVPKKTIEFPYDSTPLLRHVIQILNPM